MQRLKVRFQQALNGKEAVQKWRKGGYHLVLMDIQLPIMNGLEATKEIRRLERVNGIGVFSSGSAQAPNQKLTDGKMGEEGKGKGEGGLEEEDRLGDVAGLFKSPVIIVALTASSLQSDRHEALAAGCNDFLTKVCFYFPSLSHFPHLPILQNFRSMGLLTEGFLFSLSISYGWNAKSRNGVACRRLLTMMGGGSGRITGLATINLRVRGRKVLVVLVRGRRKRMGLLMEGLGERDRRN